MKKIMLTVLFASILVLGFVGCDSAVDPPSVKVSAISVEPKALTLTVGDTGEITATVEPEEATNKDVTWTSSDESVATVNENGEVTAVAAGEATITVTTDDGGYAATVTVIVVVPQDIQVKGNGFVNATSYKGVFVEILLPGEDNAQIESLKVELFNDEGKLIGTNTLNSAATAHGTGLTSPFVVIPEEGGYSTKSWTTSWAEGKLSANNAPEKAVITVVDKNGVSYAAEQTYNGDWSSIWPGEFANNAVNTTVSGAVDGYIVDIRLTDGATFEDAAVTVSLYDEDGKLMQSNTLPENHDWTATSLTVPFDVRGSYDYANPAWGDGIKWEVEGSVKDNYNPPAKVEIQVTLANGKVIADTLTNVTPVAGYVTNKDELNAALENPKVDIIVFGNDITLDSTLIINKAVRIDGNGYSVNQAIYITEDEVTIKNLTGKVVPREEHKISGIGGQSAFVVSADNVVLDNITVDGKSEANSAAVRGLWDAQFEVINSNISNVQTGIFAHHGNTEPEAVQNVLIATGNTFTNVWTGIGGTEKTDLTATGNTFVSIQDNGEGIGLGNGVVVIGADTEDDVNYLETNNTFNYSEGNKVVDYRSAVANISQGKYYDTVQAAIVDAASGDTIKLYDDIETTEGLQLNGKNVAFDLNGKSLNTAKLEVNNSTVVFRDSSENGEGTLATDDSSGVINAVNSNVTIENGRFVSNYNKAGSSGYANVIQVRNSELTINGGYFENNDNVGSYNRLIKANSYSTTEKTTITINGGEFVSHRNYGYIVSGDSDANVDVTINGGEFKTTGLHSYLTNVKGSVVVNDCTFTATGNHTVFNIPKDSTVTVKGGTFSVNEKAYSDTSLAGLIFHRKTNGWTSVDGTLLVDPVNSVKVNQPTYSGFLAEGATQSDTKDADGFYTISNK